MLPKSDTKFLQTYKAELEKPKWKFIVAYGLGYGLVMFVFTLAYDYFFNIEVFTAKEILIRFAIWLLGGLAYGLWFRWYAQRRVKKLERRNAAT